MKRIYLLLLLVVFGFSACEGPQGPPGADGYLDIESDDWTVEADDWVYADDPDGTNPRYECAVKFPEITQYIYQNGLVKVYLYANPDRKNDGYYPVGDVYPVELFVGDEHYIWTEYYSCLIYPGEILFVARCNDFDAVYFDEWKPGKRAFHVVWSW